MNFNRLALAVVIVVGFPCLGQIAGPLHEGSKTVTGTAPDAELQLWDINGNIALPVSATPFRGPAGGGTFTAGLQTPLFAGQEIQLESAPFDAATGRGAAVGPVIVVSPVGEWGRIRATFAAGTVLSNDTNFQGRNGTQSTLFLDFLMEKNWRWGGVTKQDDWDHRFLFTTFFETRLTSIPEVVEEVPENTASTPAPNEPPDTVATFISSRKSALVQAGGYFPYLVNKWKWKNGPQALFIAPIAKIGFITPTDNSDTGASGVTSRPVNPRQFYNYYGWGGRLGHYRLSYDKNEAPELVSYIDVIFGKYSNLETLTPVLDPSSNLIHNADGSIVSRPIRQYRVAIEGSLKVPSTPFVLGISANIGQNLHLRRRLFAAQDDLRFFFGARFDVGRMIGKLATF